MDFLLSVQLHYAINHGFKFTESARIKGNRESVKRDNNNIFDFMESEVYIRLNPAGCISSKDLYSIYRSWCDKNSMTPLKSRSFSYAIVTNAEKDHLEHCNNITNNSGRGVRGFTGVEAVALPKQDINGFYKVSERKDLQNIKDRKSVI